MTSYRYPIEPLPSPINIDLPHAVVAFDYLPHPLALPFSSEHQQLLYATKIVIRSAAAAAGMQRIQHVYPKSSVFIRIQEPTLGDAAAATALAQQYINSPAAEIPDLRATWVTLGWPSDLRPLREELAVRVVPTAIIYHDVIIDRQVVTASVLPLLSNTKVILRNGAATELNSDTEKLAAWLSGKVKVVFENIAPDTLLPRIRQQTPGDSLSGLAMVISALMMDGAGVGRDALPTILQSIDENIANQTGVGSALTVVPVPLSQFLGLIPSGKLAAGHANHFLKYLWPTLPEDWHAIVFSFAQSPRPEVTSLAPDPAFTQLQCKIGTDPALPILASGLFFFRSSAGSVTVQVTDAAGVQQSLALLHPGLPSPISGPMIQVQKAHSLFGFHKVYIGAVSSASGTDKYFGIPAELGQLQAFLSIISLQHGTTISWAACFARLMGFVAEAVAKHLEIHPVDGTQILRTASFPQFIATAAVLIASNEVKADEWVQQVDLGLGTYEYNLSDETETILAAAQIDLSSINRPAWINTHADDQDSSSGWKQFGHSRDGGHQDHFLTNAFVRMDSFNLTYNLGTYVAHEWGDKDPIDLEYNERGEEFAEWGMSSDYRPEGVEAWLIDKLVERISPTASDQ